MSLGSIFQVTILFSTFVGDVLAIDKLNILK
jgi:hypothetical protein